ncbi:ATP-binding cassette domain-containing protein [Chitinivibrio alkaliphilus]|uniref:ABC transporter, ATP-binding protein n=1 Tax=Chitinivibrio alkaliphilus ACht1 TaxID=1313304 RepID=U7D7S9_9BACT|nr:ATP-binding cassette domain-containing protein [Chitinivibrio alkaliphilus]ERP39010.1 ABC transporter, ATP-binding protein [Chitinivibrio alkaliphilus ACht1]
MKPHNALRTYPLSDLLQHYPFMEEYFAALFPQVPNTTQTLADYLAHQDPDFFEDMGTNKETLMTDAETYLEQMAAFLDTDSFSLDTLTLLPGRDKGGHPESFDEITISKGEIISIVGPTGSGKSRLLADIEWLAQGDTPTGRSLLINGQPPKMEWRYSHTHKMVAQLSQNMNFVMDLSVEEFITLHAESRLITEKEKVVTSIIAEANNLAGEEFDKTTPITSLSGGQSRALMIADTAILSSSPIVLIDEIENAGIDREKALSLLLSKEKIVLMATHDPLLALMGDVRLVIRNGGIAQRMYTDAAEQQVLQEIQAVDTAIQRMRTLLRQGERLTKCII